MYSVFILPFLIQLRCRAFLRNQLVFWRYLHIKFNTRRALKKIVLAIILFIGIVFNAYPQQSSNARWVVKRPFEFNVFIENKGQFAEKEKKDVGQPILYYSKKGKLHLYYTASSIVFRCDSLVPLDNDEERGGEKETKVKVVPEYFSIKWEGANANAIVEVQKPMSNYFTYPNLADKYGKSGITAHAFKKLVYHNLYKGIDVEFYYPEDKGGLEYDIIVHPGADPSVVKMKYTGANIALLNNDISIKTIFSNLTDHAPIAHDGSGKQVASSFMVKNNTVSFALGNYDKTQSLIIDPWVTTTSFTGANNAYDLDYDKAGNVYISGGGDATEYQINQYNSGGTLVWTYNATFAYTITGGYYGYGALCTDHRNGTCYFAEGGNFSGSGAQVLKINSAGIQKALFPGNPQVNELWRVAFDYCNNQLVLGCGNTVQTYQGATLDTALTTMKPVNVMGAITSYHDISLLALDDVGNAYMGTAKNINPTDSVNFNNVIMRMPLPSITPTIYQVKDGYVFQEVASAIYYPSLGTATAGNGFNGMVANKSMLFTYDGGTLKKFKPSNCAFVSSVKINPIPFNWGGLDLDCQGNVYAGDFFNVNVYDSNLTAIAPITFGGAGVVYALKVNGNQLYVTGGGFVAAATLPNVPKMATVTSTPPTKCSVCDGTAMAQGCGQQPFTYLWSNGATTQTITNLCSGVYTVTITDASCEHKQDTAIARLPGKPSFTAGLTITNPTCITKGQIAVSTLTGGTKPFTYAWSNGNINAQDTGLTSGTYKVTITDSSGCIYDTTVTLTSPKPPIIKVTPASDSICVKGSAIITASGATSYSWSPSAGLSCTNCTSPTASPGITITYTVVGDSAGCVNKDSVTITVNNPPTILVTPPHDTICFGGSASLSATGAASYIWQPATGLSCTNCPNPSASPSSQITYTVTGTDLHGCVSTATASVYIAGPVATACCDTTILAGGSASIGTTTSGTSYAWSPVGSLGCSTCFVTSASPIATTTYTLVVTFNNGCKAEDSVTVQVKGCDNVWIPNSFSPNGDGKNDMFGPKGECMVNYSLYVFNRWGTLIYQSESGKPWDGKVKGNLVQEDVYVYTVNVLNNTGNTISQTGRVTVIR